MSLGLCLGGVTQEGTMISNLPLLFADGYPTCLEKITVDQLEKFVPFMIQCSSGHDTSRKVTSPKWWPKDLMFSIPLVKPPGVESKWLAILKNLVCRCYTYHGCEFMLRFCTDLSQCPTSELMFADSWDGTTSLFNKATGKLLVTFRNENMCYDRKKESPRKTLLPRNDVETIRPQIMVQPPLFDIYLCDNCDGEFSTLKEVQDHEKVCCRGQREPSRSPVATDILNTDQEKFLNFIQLKSSLRVLEEENVQNADPARYKRTVGNSLRYTGIPLSSPLGILVYKKSRACQVTPGVQLDRMERYCSAKPSDANVKTREQKYVPWPVSWKPRKKTDDNNDWVHMYKNPRRQWRRRAPFMHNDAVPKAEHLTKCHNLQVQLKRLTPDEIKFYTSPHSVVREQHCSSNEIDRLVNSSTDSIQQKSGHCVSLGMLKVHDCTLQNKHILCKAVEDGTSAHGGDNGSLKYSLNSAAVKVSFDHVTDLSPSTKSCSDFPLETQLLPNTLYMYNKSISSQKRVKAASCEIKSIPIIDLVSSDEECEIISHRDIGEQCFIKKMNCGSCIADKTLNTEDSTFASNLRACEDQVAHGHCSDYKKTLPYLVNLYSSPVVNFHHVSEADHCVFVADDSQRDSSAPVSVLHKAQPAKDKNEKLHLQSFKCDKAVQCTYDEFPEYYPMDVDASCPRLAS